jgi:hypothetical protein
MFLRLWWKDARQFWPMWAFLAALVAFYQYIIVYYHHDRATETVFLPLALFWSGVYALAAGSAAFAGERETRTLGFLDAIPVPRRVLWNSKASFAFVSTLGVAIVLAILAESATTRGSHQGIGTWEAIVAFTPIVVESLCWGLFWSSFLPNALFAASLSIACLTIDWFILAPLVPGFGVIKPSPNRDLARSIGDLSYLAFIPSLIALFLSRSIVTYRENRSSRRVARARSRVRIRLVREPEVPGTAIRVRRERFATTRRLVWQTLTVDSARFSITLVAASLPILIFQRLQHSHQNLPFFERSAITFIFALFVGLETGIGVFSWENARETYRFYVHNGVRPGFVWLVKQFVWIGILTFAIMTCLAAIQFTNGDQDQPDIYRGRETVYVFALILHCYAVGQFMGMILPRAITAFVLGMCVAAITAIPPVAIASGRLAPAWILMTTPILFLGASYLWVSDWMNGRRNVASWARLASFVVAVAAAEISIFGAYRAFSVPNYDDYVKLEGDVPAQILMSKNAQETGRTLENLATDIHCNRVQFNNQVGEMLSVIRRGWKSDSKTAVEFWSNNKDLIDEIRRAALRPETPIRPIPLGVDQSLTPAWVNDLYKLAILLGLDASERRSRADLAGAWDDIEAMINLGRRVTVVATSDQWLVGHSILTAADALAADWSLDARLTAGDIERALKSLLKTPEGGTFADSIRVEAWLAIRRIRSGRPYPANLQNDMYLLINDVLMFYLNTPWERERSYRVIKLIAAASLDWCDREYHARDPIPIDGSRNFFDLTLSNGRIYRSGDLEYHFRTTPAAVYQFPYDISPSYYSFDRPISIGDAELAVRRALPVALAIRLYSHKNPGQVPLKLESLVPEFLPQIPINPFSGKPFKLERVDTDGPKAFSVDSILQNRFDQAKSSDDIDLGVYHWYIDLGAPEIPKNSWKRYESDPGVDKNMIYQVTSPILALPVYVFAPEGYRPEKKP